MKNLNWFNKFIFFLNIIAALSLLFSYLLPYIPPTTFALISVLSLGVPVLILINFIFLIYWFFLLKKQLFLSMIVLLLGINHITSIYEVSSSEDPLPGVPRIEVMSYNVRQFNQFKWSDLENIPKQISSFITEQDPDILSMQEYYKGELIVADRFPYKYVKVKSNENAEFGLAILSKFPIVNSGSLDFPDKSNNNAIYADIVVDTDTIRVINVHLQSFEVKPNFDNLEQQEAKRVFLGMGQTFVRQERQMEAVVQLIRETPYEDMLVMGDFNNTAYSYIYRELKSEGFFDAYKEAGNGFGKSFTFRFIPLRIDFILASESFEILGFETFDVPYSDHKPVGASFRLLDL